MRDSLKNELIAEWLEANGYHPKDVIGLKFHAGEVKVTTFDLNDDNISMTHTETMNWRLP